MIAWPKKPANQYFTESECGRWRINRCAVRHGTGIVMRYRLWKRNGEKWTPHPENLSSFESADKAKEQAK